MFLASRWAILLMLAIPMGTLAEETNPPVQFIENLNQWPCQLHFGARVAGGDLWLEPGRLQFRFLDQRQLEAYHHQGHEGAEQEIMDHKLVAGRAAAIELLGANQAAQPIPFDLLSTYYNFYQGSDPGQWASHAKAYRGVTYPEIYPGISWKVYSQDEALKYDFIIAAGGDPDQIKIQYQGVDRVRIVDGAVHVAAGFLNWREEKPMAYQVVGGKNVPVACEYRYEDGRLSFYFPNGYDSCEELIIDPVLIFSTYSGSVADNWGSSATPGEGGTLYSAGVTNHFVNNIFSGVFPATMGAFQMDYGGIYDVAILKYDSTGRQLLYASYLGGSGSESPHSLVVNENNELFVLGTTSSTDFPTTVNAYSRSFSGGEPVEHVIKYTLGSDLFLAKISSDGSSLLASTFLGGSNNDGINASDSPLTANYGDQLRGDVITDFEGNVFISSVTASFDFPFTNGFSNTYQGGASDAAVVKMDKDLSTIIWSNAAGGNGTDAAHSIKVASNGDVFIAGGTTSANFPVSSTAYQIALSGYVDGWIATISADGKSLKAATFTGTPFFDQIYFIDLNDAGDVFAYGQTSGNFPITPGVYSNPNSGQFLQKLDASLSTLVFSTVFGSGRGVPDISPTAFLVSECNNIYLTGWGGRLNPALGFWNSDTRNLPISSNAYQKTTSGSDFYFIVLTDDAKEFLYGTYLGGTKSATHVDGGTSRFDKSGIVYHAVCSGCRPLNIAATHTSDFPTTPGAWSATNNSINCNNAAFKFDLSLLRARIQTNNVQLKKPGIRLVCFPDEIVFQNTSTGGKFYEWNLGDGTKLFKDDTARIVHRYDEPGIYQVKLKVLDNGTCLGKDSTMVTIEVSKVLSEVTADVTICNNSSVRLSASGGATYRWLSNDGAFQSNEGSPLVSPKDTTSYFVTITNKKGCIKKDTVTVGVVPGIDLNFDFSKQYDCESRPRLSVTNRTKESEEGTYWFDFGDGSQSQLSEDVHDFAEDGVYTVKLLGRKEFCVYEFAKEIPIYTIRVPNVITPADRGNQGSKNDTFRFRYGDPPTSGTPPEARLSIFNRWGELVYDNDDYKGDWGGEGLSEGVYYYELEITGETTCKSWIHVIK